MSFGQLVMNFRGFAAYIIAVFSAKHSRIKLQACIILDIVTPKGVLRLAKCYASATRKGL